MVPPCSDRVSRAPPYSRMILALRIRGYHPLRPDFPDRSASTKTTTGLLRFRSPLLAESPLMSVPPGTEMFQFPRVRLMTLCIQAMIPHKGGLPHSDTQGSTPRSRLPLDFRSVPRPSSPPGAKGIHPMPFSWLIPRAHPQQARTWPKKPRHAQEPSTAQNPRQRTIPVPRQSPHSAHTLTP